MTHLSKEYWVVLTIYKGKKNAANIMLNFNSTHLWYISESYLDCLKMSLENLPDHLGAGRLYFKADTVILKLSPIMIENILRRTAEITADNLSDYVTVGYAMRYKDLLFLNFIAELMLATRLDFRLPDAGIKMRASETVQW